MDAAVGLNEYELDGEDGGIAGTGRDLGVYTVRESCNFAKHGAKMEDTKCKEGGG